MKPKAVWARIGLVVGAYVVSAWVAGALTLPPTSVLSFRPPNALLLALALLDRPERWWLYVLATVPGNPALYERGVGWIPALGYVLANVVEVTLGLTILRRVLGRTPKFSQHLDCVVFVIGVAGVASMAAATIGATIALAELPPRGVVAIWRTWFFADALSFMTFTPVVLLVAQRRWRLCPERRWEAAAMAVGLIAIAIPAFGGTFGQVHLFPALVYAPLPFLVWAAVRFGPAENAVTVFVFSGAVLATALSGKGAFAGLSAPDSMLSMQVLLLTSVGPLLMLAAMVEEHRQVSERFAKAFQSTPDVITISRLGDDRLIEVNESFERMSGYAREEALERTETEVGLWSDPAARDAFLRRVAAEGRVHEYPVVTTTHDGGTRHSLVSAERLDFDGADAVIAIWRDVTSEVGAAHDRAALESQLRQTGKMQAIGQLAGGIAHDFNNMLHAIRGYAELVIGALPSNDRAYLAAQQVVKVVDRAAALTNQLLTFSRREPLQPEPVDLNAVVDGVSQMLDRVIGEQVQFGVLQAPALPAIDADASEIEQVVMNLCINARDAMPGGGRLSLETGAVTFSDEDCRSRPWARAGRWVFLRVGDEGTGIAPEVLPRIFEPFFTTKDIGHGTGLGLATVYAIVERHGGLLAVDTSEGVGTTVAVYFPAAAGVAVSRAEAKVEPAAAAAGGERILVAEDDGFVREVFVETLEAAGYRVIVACDGAEADALVRARAAEIDGAVLDVVMPFLNGRQVYDRIRQLRPGLPVLFCSGYSFGELADVSSLPGTAFLAKPYSGAVLLRTLRSLLDERTGRSEPRAPAAVVS